VFYVDVAGDRLTLDDPTKRPPLAKWPDGSLPMERAAEVGVINSLREWRTPMSETFRRLELSPFRVQAFGRGTYLVISLTGLRPPVAKEASDPAMREALRKLCAANEARNFAVTTALDNATWLRVRCPDGSYTWDKR
jgi:hypothetical protein